MSIEPTQLVSLAVKASEAMRRVSVGIEKKQFQYSSEHNVEDKVCYNPPYLYIHMISNIIIVRVKWLYQMLLVCLL